MSQYVRWPSATSGITTYSTLSAFPATATDGAAAVALDTDDIYIYNAGSTSWILVGGPGAVLGVGTIDSTTASANGAAVSANQLIMQSASATVPGLVNTSTQSLAGNKTFTGTISASNLSGTNTGDVTLSAVGSSPSANAASLAGQVLTLQPADGTHPGVLTIGAQTLAGAKTFSSTIVGNISGNAATVTTNANLTGPITSVGNATSVASQTGTGSTFVMNTAPTMTNPIVGTQSQGDSSTKAASTSYVDVAIANAIAGVNPAVAVQAATTAASDTSSFTYNNGVSGIGATLTGAINTALTVDGYTFTALGQRLLVKNDTQSPSGAFNGIYYVTQVQTGILPVILTRALDYDTPSDTNNTGSIPVVSGTVNGTTSWVLTSSIATVGTDPLTFTQFTRNPADYLLKTNNLSDVTTKATAFNNVSPVTSTGDLIIGNGSNSNTRLAKGTQYQLLQATATTAAYDAVHLDQSAAVTGVLPNANTTAVSTNTASTIVTRDGSGNFSAGTITAALSGNATTATSATAATNATNVGTTQVSNSASYFPLMVSSSTNGNQACDLGTGLTFNPSTNVLTTTTFSGALSGNATTATTATNATNTAITDDTTTNATMYPTWVTTTTGNLPQKVSSTKLTFNPSTAALTTTTFVGALTGTASGNTTYTANQYGLVTSGSANVMTVIAPNASTAFPLISGGTGAVPSWAKLSEAGGGTNQTSYATGDILYASATNILSKLAAGTNGYVLTQGATIPSWAASATANSSSLVQNVGLTGTVASNALTIALKQSDASTDPSSGAPCVIGFRNTTSATGSYTLVNATAATSLVISSGSTLGQVSGKAGYVYVYAINNAGTVELAASSTRYDDGSVVTTVAEGGAGAATSRFSVYSTSVRTGVAIRLLGRILATEATAGTWASAVTEISLTPIITGHQTLVGTAQTSSGTSTSTTFAAPTNTPTITFTPGKTGRYKIYCSGIAQNGTAVEDSSFRINATAGSPVVVFSEESQFTAPGAGYRVPFSVYQLVWLTNATSYTFQLEVKVTAGTVTVTSANLTSGIALIAEHAD